MENGPDPTCGKQARPPLIREHVWAGDTFVDFEQGLNFCIRQIREAVGDAADSPRFIETLPRRGYRFLHARHIWRGPPQSRAAGDAPDCACRFACSGRIADTAFLALSLPDALTVSLSGLESLVVRSSLAAARFAEGDPPDAKTVVAETDVDMIVSWHAAARGRSDTRHQSAHRRGDAARCSGPTRRRRRSVTCFRCRMSSPAGSWRRCKLPLSDGRTAAAASGRTGERPGIRLLTCAATS